MRHRHRMTRVLPLRPSSPPEMHARAMDNLRFIRETMEAAATFTAVSGWGTVVIGVTAIGAAALAAAAHDTTRKILFSFAPPMMGGALLTLVFFQRGLVPLLPGVWMLLYGIGVVAAGTFSVRIVPV